MAVIRAARDDDAAAFIALVRDSWLEYPGCVFDLEADAPELAALASHVAAEGGAVWAAERDGAVVGMVGTHPLADGRWELVRMYVAAAARGTGLAARLVATVEAHARGQGATQLVLWSDTRFARAHAFYEKQDFLRSGPIRVVNDLSNTLEFAYRKPLVGVEIRMLDAMEAESAAGRLAAIAGACAGAEACRGLAFWRGRAALLARGERALGIAWLDGRIVGGVLLDLAMPSGEAHRAAVEALMVLPEARARGIGGALLVAAAAAARRDGRRLLTAMMPEAGAAARLALARGWRLAGSVPGYAAAGSGGGAGGISWLYKILG